MHGIKDQKLCPGRRGKARGEGPWPATRFVSGIGATDFPRVEQLGEESRLERSSQMAMEF